MWLNNNTTTNNLHTTTIFFCYYSAINVCENQTKKILKNREQNMIHGNDNLERKQRNKNKSNIVCTPYYKWNSQTHNFNTFRLQVLQTIKKLKVSLVRIFLSIKNLLKEGKIASVCLKLML